MKSILFILFIALTVAARCQQKVCPTELNMVVGAGIPEMFYGGVRVNHKQWHFDLSGGTSFDRQFTVSGNAAYHFGLKSIEGNCALKHWFTSFGGSYMQWESTQAFGRDVYLNGRIGRDFHLTDWFKLSLSLGPGVSVYHYKYDKDPGGWNFDIWFPVIPSGQFSMQFKLFEFIKSPR